MNDDRLARLGFNGLVWPALVPYRPLGLAIIRMESKRFLNTLIRIPCLIIKTGRQIRYKIMGYNDKLKHIIKFSEMIKAFGFR